MDSVGEVLEAARVELPHQREGQQRRGRVPRQGGKSPSKQVIAFLAIAAVLVVGGLIYLAIRASQSPLPQPVPVAAVTPGPTVIATPGEEKAPPTPEVVIQPSAQPTAPVSVATPNLTTITTPSGTGETGVLAADLLGKPTHYFNDYASLIYPRTAQELDRRLEDFERQTSNQILVVIYPSLPKDAAIEHFTLRAFNTWKPGQKEKNNGVILFVFAHDRKVRLETGLGLENALPDSLCLRIITDQIKPRFAARNFAGGLTAAIDSIMTATRDAYKGTGKTMAEQHAAQ